MSVAAEKLNVVEPAEASPAGIPTPSVLAPADLYRTHFSFVWRNLRRLGVPDNLLEDAAQDVYLTVHRRWDSYDSERSSVQSWLFGIILRVARGHRRTIRRRFAQLLSFSERSCHAASATTESPAELACRRESLALLDRILDSLDEEKRTVLLLVDVEQLTVTEAAEVLGVNLNTLYWRLRVARQGFQRAVDRVRAVESRMLGGSCP